MTAYSSKRKPRAKQAEALKKSKGKAAFAFLMAMRTGKTKVVCDEYGELEFKKKVDDLFILAPAGVYHTWAKDDEKDPGGIYADFSDDIRKRMEVHIWESGTYKSKKRQQELSAFLAHNGPRILVMNAEALSTVEDARLLVAAFIKNGRRVYCAIDESTLMKNPKAKRTKFINKNIAPYVEPRRILSGLITPRSPLDLYTQFEFLDRDILGYPNYYSFRARFAVMKKVDFGHRHLTDIVVGYRDVEQLQAFIRPYSFRVRLEDCYDLPPSSYAFREVKLTKEQERIYDELKTFATAELKKEKHVTATLVITKLLRLHQVICGHVSDEEGNFTEIPENRTDELISLLEEYDGKAIIWCSYDHDVRKVSEALQKSFKVKVARFWGGNKKTREEEERMFKTDKDCPYMVATPSAGGKGRTWDVANLVVYYSCTNDLEHRSQSEERPKGVGKEFSIQYIDMVARGTVEEKIVKALRDKIDIATIINGDNYKEWLI